MTEKHQVQYTVRVSSELVKKLWKQRKGRFRAPLRFFTRKMYINTNVNCEISYSRLTDVKRREEIFYDL